MTKRIMTLMLIGWVLTLVAGDQLICSVCRKRISGNYVKGSDGTIYCSRGCAEKNLPKCSVCKRRISGKHFNQAGKLFCSQRCLQAVMPKCETCAVPMQRWTVIVGHKFCPKCSKLPRCSECMLPSVNGRKYKDGRVVCAECGKTTLFKEADAKKYFLKARSELKTLTNLQTTDVPTLKLSSNDEIIAMAVKQMNAKPTGLVRGFYHRLERYADVNDKTPESVEKTIYMLYGMRKETYLVTGVHEFTHDLISEKFPRLKNYPSWVQEGICQYTAFAVARKYKLNSHALVILHHPDKAYGDGFRFFVKALGPNNWKGLRKWMETVDVKSLPKHAPIKK